MESINSYILLLRDYRSQELRILLAAVLCAVICITSMTFSIDSIKKLILNNSAALLGADRVISANESIQQDLRTLATKNGLSSSDTINFYSMLSTDKNLVLSSVKAVAANFPLRGATQKTVPAAGTIWLESAAMLMLEVSIGDKITVGDATFVIAKLLNVQVDSIPDGLSFAPRSLINIDDVPKTKVVIPGSRATYKLLLAGSAPNLQRFDNAVTKILPADYTIITPNSKDGLTNNALQQSEKYLGLALLVNLILSAVVIGLATNRYVDKHIKDVAVMRCMGANAAKIITIYNGSLLLFSLLVGLLGSMLGYGVQQILACILQHYMHLQLPTPGWQPLAISLFTAVLVVMGAATPALFSLARITPLQILRQQSISRQNFSWLNNFSKPLSYKLPALLRLSLANILTNARNNLIQVLAFATVIAVALLLLIIRNDLLVTWQAQQTTNTPNYYVVNIAPENVASMQNILADNAIQTSEFYPLVRGLLIKINQQPVSMGPEENGKRTGIHRPLNLTWTARLPVDNKIRQGAWFSAADIGKPVLSIESSIAERLQVKLGDELTFMINMREINAKITSIRAVRWGDFKPNFYVIYPAGVIDNFPVTYMASFYVPEAKLKTMLALSRRFPEINLLNVTNMLNQAETILMLASFVIGYIWFFTLMISILLLLAVVLTSISMRNYQNNLMRILGASKAQILKVLGIEYFTLGCISGLAGAGLAIGLGKYVAKRFFQTSYPINWSVLVFGCLAGGLIMLCGGILGTRKSLSIAPIQLSRNLN